MRLLGNRLSSADKMREKTPLQWRDSAQGHSSGGEDGSGAKGGEERGSTDVKENGTREGASWMWEDVCLVWVCSHECRTEEAVARGEEMKRWFRGMFEGGVVKEVDCVEGGEIDFGKPPISVVGTDWEHRREVSKGAVARFVNHLRAWREVFHGGFKIGIIVECGSEVLFGRGDMEGIEMGWEVVLLGNGDRGREVVKVVGGSGRGDLGGYVIARKAVERLLSGATAFIVPLHEFVGYVFEEGGVSVWKVGGEQRGGLRCEGAKREVRTSDKFPFHAPLHRWHKRERRVE